MKPSDLRSPMHFSNNSSSVLFQISLLKWQVISSASISSTYFFVDGKPMSAEDFIKRLFDTLHLPKLFESEEKLLPFNRARWFGTDVVYYSIDTIHFVDDSV